MWINGKPANTVSALDRGLLYGDGAFETLLLRQGRPVLLEAHLQRLQKACLRLHIDCSIPILRKELEDFLLFEQRLDESLASSPSAILKIIITRGQGGRGYRPGQALQTQRLLQLHPTPEDTEKFSHDGIAVQMCQHPVSTNSRLAGLKHLNRLDQVLASMELPDTLPEGLMCDEQGYLIEGTRSNLFLVLENRVCTPALTRAGVDGIIRQTLLAAFAREGVQYEIRDIPKQELAAASELFVCNSVIGIWPVTAVHEQGRQTLYPVGPHTRHAQLLLQPLMS